MLIKIYFVIGSNSSAAFSITSAAKDIELIINSEQSDREIYLYAVSYGTIWLERLMEFSPSNVKGYILDGIVPQSMGGQNWESSTVFSNWDKHMSKIGILITCNIAS